MNGPLQPVSPTNVARCLRVVSITVISPGGKPLARATCQLDAGSSDAEHDPPTPTRSLVIASPRPAPGHRAFLFGVVVPLGAARGSAAPVGGGSPEDQQCDVQRDEWNEKVRRAHRAHSQVDPSIHELATHVDQRQDRAGQQRER